MANGKYSSVRLPALCAQLGLCAQVVNALRRSFKNGAMRTIDARLEQLTNLQRMLVDNEQLLCDAVYKDIRRSKPEVLVYELALLHNELLTCIADLPSWTRPRAHDRSLLVVLCSPSTQYDALGVVLLIGAWNYPLLLALHPLISALAAGNCAILKPSEIAVNTGRLLTKLIPKYLSPEVCRVVEGGPAETTELLTERFDHIFFTGSPTIGRVIMQAAAKHLTPVTLELGGKNPCIVDETCDLPMVAKRIVWGKFVSCGQICLAPDYLLCVEKVKSELVRHIIAAIQIMYTADPKTAPDYSRIINERHFKRLQPLITANGPVLYGGEHDIANLYIAPTLVSADRTHPIMVDEIFGPILPIISVNSIDDAIDFVNDGEKPLAIYLFSKDKHRVNSVLQRTSSGGVTVNDCVLHMACDSLPFGGVGNSGMGRYHGKYGFETFSHQKSVLHCPQRFELLMECRYPPLTAGKLRMAKIITSKLTVVNLTTLRFVLTLVFGFALGVLAAYMF